MKTTHVSVVLGGTVLLALGLAACAPAPTPIPPTATAVPPTAATTPPSATAVPSTATRVPATPTAAAAPTTMAEEHEMAKEYPKAPPSVGAGAKVYTANCASCHGDKGDGTGSMAAGLQPPPADFTDADFAHGDPPEDWFSSITNGRPGTAMPAFQDKLSENDRWNVLFYVRNFATTPQKIADGKELYAKNCALCHGEKGDGKGPAATTMNPAPADFTDAQMMSAHASKELYDTLTDGKGAMPGFKNSLSDDQRWSLVDYLWTFVYAP